jgi:hypothetical protein
MARDEIDLDLMQTISLDQVTIDPLTEAPVDIEFLPIDIYLHLDVIANIFEELTGAPWNISLSDGFLEDDTIYPYASETDIVTNELGDRFTMSDNAAYAEREAMIYENTSGQNATIIISELAAEVNDMYHYATDDGAGNTYDAILTIYLVTKTAADPPVVLTNQTIAHKEWHDVYESHVKFDFTWNTIDTELTIPVGGKIEMRMVFERGASWNNSTSYIGGRLELHLKLTEKTDGAMAKDISCFFPHEAFTRLIQLMTSETDQTKLFYSEFFGRTDSQFVTYTANGEGALDAITTGYRLRRFQNMPLPLNFRDIFKTYDFINCLGLGFDKVNDRFYIAERADFYNEDYFMFDLGDVTELVITPYKDSYYSEIESGYEEKGEYEQFAGVNEFNIQTSHGLRFPVKEKLSLRAPYNTDSIGMELARRAGYYTLSSKDTRYDDKIYIVRTDGSQTIQVGSTVTGFEGVEQYYNIAFTPRENLLRHKDFINPGLWKHELTKRVKYLNSSKKINIYYFNQLGNHVHEHDDLSIAELGYGRAYNPEYYEFKAPITRAMIVILNTDPHGYVRFSFDGINYEGYIDDVQIDDYPKTSSWKLIGKDAAAETTKLFMDDSIATFEDGITHVLNKI